MKVYVDSNDIGTTVTYKEENGKKEYIYCHDREGFVFKDLSDYTKQVRKEVIEEIKKNADVILEEGVYENYITGEKTIMTKTIYNIDEVKLDQIQGETK